VAVEVSGMTDPQVPIEDADLRARALARLNKKREFFTHLFVYAVVNAVLIAIWAMTGATFFWPIFPLLGWGIGVVFHALDVYQRPISEERIEQEMDELRQR
jgi:uncharacterized membrane protein